MFAGPIGVYFLTLHTIFKGLISFASLNRLLHLGLIYISGNSTWAGAAAAIAANVVLITYIIVAVREDESEKLSAEQKARKAK